MAIFGTIIFTIRNIVAANVMFLHLSVSHSVHRGVYPSMHWGRHPLQADMSQHALGQTPPPGRHVPACTGKDPSPQADISQHALGQTPPPLGRHIPACTRADTPTPGQTYPSMHSGRQPPDGHYSGRYASYWNAFLFYG